MDKKCALSERYSDFISIAETTSEILTLWTNVLNRYQQMYDVLNKEILPLLDHLHSCHWHPLLKMHEANQYPNDTGYSAGCSNISCLDRLVQEITTETDVDDNGSIYGKEFILNPTDESCPRILKNVQTQYELSFEKYSSNMMNFINYFKHFKIMQRCSPKTPVQKLILHMVLKENPDNPKSQFYGDFNKDATDDSTRLCITEVYGKTFIIDPNDKNKPTELVNFEKTVNIPTDINIISWEEYLQKCQPSYIEKNIDDNTSSKSQICDYVCTRLVGEWLTGTDIDKNGIIYGRDFMFHDNEPNKCRCLRELEIDLDWNPPSTIKIIFWNQFLDTFENRNPDDREEI